jgi:hypothetical protein
MRQADREPIALRHQQRRKGGEERLRRLVHAIWRRCQEDPETPGEVVAQMIRRAGEQPTDA